MKKIKFDHAGTTSEIACQRKKLKEGNGAIRKSISNVSASCEAVVKRFNELYSRIYKTYSNVAKLKANFGGQNLEFSADNVKHIGNCVFTILMSKTYDFILPKYCDGKVFYDFDSDWLMPRIDLFHDIETNQSNILCDEPTIAMQQITNKQNCIAFEHCYFTPIETYEQKELDSYLESIYSEAFMNNFPGMEDGMNIAMAAFAKLYELSHSIIQTENEIKFKSNCFINELRFVAKHAGVTLAVYEKYDEDEIEIVSVLNEIEKIINEMVLFEAKLIKQAHGFSIISFNIGGHTISVSRSTLMQAPQKSFLYRIGNNCEIDCDGRIVLKVNLPLFTSIINYLRLKAMLPEVQLPPPIMVLAEQYKTMKRLVDMYCDGGIEINKLPV